MAEISADISAKKGSFWIEPLTAYSRVLESSTRSSIVVSMTCLRLFASACTQSYIFYLILIIWESSKRIDRRSGNLKKRFGNTVNRIQISAWVQPGSSYTYTSTLTTGTVYCTYTFKEFFNLLLDQATGTIEERQENGEISIGNQDISGDAFVAVAKVRDSIIPLGGQHGVEVIIYSRVVRPIPRRGTNARGARGRENITGDALITVAELGDGIVGLGFVDGVEVVKDGGLIGSVEWDGLGLLCGEDVAGYAFCGVAEDGGCVVHLCFVGGVEVVCDLGIGIICTVEWNGFVGVRACGGRGIRRSMWRWWWWRWGRIRWSRWRTNLYSGRKSWLILVRARHLNNSTRLTGGGTGGQLHAPELGGT